MEKALNGIHHITVIAGNPQDNYDFYTQPLGLRMIKKTINFDAPDVYHLYYADEKGTPGTVLTFFPFPNATRGKRGTREISIVSFSVPSASLNYWIDRFAKLAIEFDVSSKKFGYDYITLFDPDGMKIEIVADPNADMIEGWDNGDLPKEHSIRKFFGATFNLNKATETEKLLSQIMGMSFIKSENNIKRYSSGKDESLCFVDIIENENGNYAVSSAGSVHHIAWRTANDEEQINWRNKFLQAGYHPTEVVDRNYFHSIYFREPGGILFEIATDQPGFMVDETFESLGTELKLPPWYESKRKTIESGLMLIKTKTSSKK